jgi:hypothetical protein
MVMSSITDLFSMAVAAQEGVAVSSFLGKVRAINNTEQTLACQSHGQ